MEKLLNNYREFIRALERDYFDALDKGEGFLFLEEALLRKEEVVMNHLKEELTQAVLGELSDAALPPSEEEVKVAYRLMDGEATAPERALLVVRFPGVRRAIEAYENALAEVRETSAPLLRQIRWAKEKERKAIEKEVKREEAVIGLLEWASSDRPVPQGKALRKVRKDLLNEAKAELRSANGGRRPKSGTKDARSYERLVRLEHELVRQGGHRSGGWVARALQRGRYPELG